MMMYMYKYVYPCIATLGKIESHLLYINYSSVYMCSYCT